MADLSTVLAVKRQLEIKNDDDNDLLALYVTEATQLFETECARTFTPTVGTLFYDSAYPVVEGRMLYFDQDVIGVDSVSNGANGTLAASSYRLLPLHYSPKYALQLNDQSGLFWQTGNDGSRQNAIVVIGTTGYSTVANRPADVTLAVTKLAAFLYQNRNNNDATVQMADGTTLIPAQVPGFVLRVISKYTRRVAYSAGDHA